MTEERTALATDAQWLMHIRLYCHEDGWWRSNQMTRSCLPGGYRMEDKDIRRFLSEMCDEGLLIRHREYLNRFRVSALREDEKHRSS